MSDLASNPASTTFSAPHTALLSSVDARLMPSPILLEIDLLGIFLRLLRVELYARTERAPSSEHCASRALWNGPLGASG
jgi:hypothetical protein